MTATITSLDSRRSRRAPACGCPRHRLEALVARSISALAVTEGELVVDRQVVTDLVDDLAVTVRDALDTPHGKTNP